MIDQDKLKTISDSIELKDWDICWNHGKCITIGTESHHKITWVDGLIPEYIKVINLNLALFEYGGGEPYHYELVLKNGPIFDLEKDDN